MKQRRNFCEAIVNDFPQQGVILTLLSKCGGIAITLGFLLLHTGMVNADASFRFDLNERAASPIVIDKSGSLSGAVVDAADAIHGDGFFHGDGINNGILVSDNAALVDAIAAFSVEARLHPAEMGSGDEVTIQRIFSRHRW